MKRTIERILLLCAAFFIMCTDNKLVDGGSSSEVIATVDGRILDKDGKAGEGVEVMLMPSAYNPLKSTGARVYQSETDTDGFYSFDSIVKGSYNLFARNHLDLTRVLDLGVTVETERLMIKDNYLEKPASVTVALPESIDTSDGYVILEGTPLYWPVRKITEMSDGSRAITLDSLPAGRIGALKYVELHGRNEYTITTSSITKENDTVKIGIDSQAKPVWTIPLIVGITHNTMVYSGGMDTARKKIDSCISAVNEKINDANAFAGKLNFRVDSLYSFTTSCSLQIGSSYPEKYMLRLIMDGYSDENAGYWSGSRATAYKAVEAGKFLTDLSISAIAWQFALSRGAFPSSYMLVPSSGNPINGKAFTGQLAFMYYPYSRTDWDTYNVYAINHYRDSGVPDVIPCIAGYPASVGIVTQAADSTPVGGAKISLYGVKWNSGVVSDTLLDTITNGAGSFVSKDDLYNPDNHGNTPYCNILIRAVSGSDTAYCWLPLNELGIAYYENPEQDFRKVIRFSR